MKRYFFRRRMSASYSPAERKMAGAEIKKFSWEDICMYLYGHLPVEPSPVAHHRVHSISKRGNSPGNRIFTLSF